MDKKEYRYHYIEIDKTEKEQDIIKKINEIINSNNDMGSNMSNLLYATNDSLSGDSGDSFYNETFKNDIVYVSKLFPEVTFKAGWVNEEDRNDDEKFIVVDGKITNISAKEKANKLIFEFMDMVIKENNRLKELNEQMKNSELDEIYELDEIINIYESILNYIKKTGKCLK